MDAPSFGPISSSSRGALLWAGALAGLRVEAATESSIPPEANSFDLLVGMLLEHPKDGEPLHLLRHFDLSAGQLLPGSYPRPSPDALQRALAALPADRPPPLDPEVGHILEVGMKLGLGSGSSEVAELRALFAALLLTPNVASTALRDLLAARGATLEAVAKSTEEYVQRYPQAGEYPQLLAQRHPFSPHPVDIPNYKADHGRKTDLGDDLVNIRAEVDAFAYLLASRGLRPPLAVGLFGDWGSGKSFFMEAVRGRIEQLTGDPQVVAQPQAEVPFWKRIVQIQFNAWHYVEGDLWASLVDHIFNQLRLGGDTSDDLVQKRRDHWLKQLDDTRAQAARLESQRSAAARDLQDKQQQAELLRRQRESELARLERLKARTATDVVIDKSIKEVEEALAPYLLYLGRSKNSQRPGPSYGAAGRRWAPCGPTRRSGGRSSGSSSAYRPWYGSSPGSTCRRSPGSSAEWPQRQQPCSPPRIEREPWSSRGYRSSRRRRRV